MSNETLALPSEIGFQVSARTMQMLGRENVSSPIVALLEIVKNAYDADANSVLVEFNKASLEDGYIRIYDDGEGMAYKDLEEKWLVISTDNKKIADVTRRKKRRKVGEKGIGRLGLDRLSRRTTLTTKAKGHRALKIVIDWAKYERADKSLQEVKHPISSPDDLQTILIGTELLLTDLRDRWTRKMYDDLYTALSLLVPPRDIEDASGFKIFFECDEWPDRSGEVASPMPTVAEYRLESVLSSDGIINYQAVYQPTGETSPRISKWWEEADIAPGTKPVCGPVKFILYFYLRDEKERLKELGITSKELRDFLKTYQGIRIYRDSFRVMPYGDPKSGEDWLGLNRRRVSHPGGVRSGDWRLAENQVVGTILISRNHNPELEDQTNREGLIQNQAYQDLRNFILYSIQFLERERIERYMRETPEVDPRVIVTAASSDLTKGARKLRENAEKLKDVDSYTHGQLISQAEEMERLSGALTTAGDAIADTQTEKQTMIGLATLGIAVAAFGHETIRDITAVLNRADFLKESVEKLPAKTRKDAVAHLRALNQAAERVQDWGQFALERVGGSKRVRKEIDINLVIEDILHTFRHTLVKWGIDSSDVHLSKSLPSFRGFEMDIESILINFITNTLEAMRFTPRDRRKVHVATNYLGVENAIRIRFADSGKGIAESDAEKVFSPLFSTKVDERGEPIGTGMGLAIVKDIVEAYRGEIKVKGRGKLGGAEFDVILPLTTDAGDNDND